MDARSIGRLARRLIRSGWSYPSADAEARDTAGARHTSHDAGTDPTALEMRGCADGGADGESAAIHMANHRSRSSLARADHDAALSYNLARGRISGDGSHTSTDGTGQA